MQLFGKNSGKIKLYIIYLKVWHLLLQFINKKENTKNP